MQIPWEFPNCHELLKMITFRPVNPRRLLSYCLGGPLQRSVAFLLLLLATWVVPAQSIVLNEVMARNQKGLRDENGDFSDWIELFNPGPSELDLQGYALSDDPANPFRWVLTNSVLPAGQFLVLFADGKDRQPGQIASVSPRELPGLRSWLKASEIATNDATVVRRSGSQVFIRKWNDLSGSGAVWNQTFSSQQPLLLASNVLTRTPAAVRFDGLDDFLAWSSPPPTNNFCLVAVIRSRTAHEIDAQANSGASGVSGQRYLFGANHGGAANAGMGVSAGTNGISIYEHGDGYMPALAVLATDLPGFQILTLQYSNKIPRIFWQGNLAATGNTSPRAHVTAPTNLGTGSYGSWSGDLAELLVFDSSLSEGQVLGLHEHLSAQYGIPLRRYWHANFAVSLKGETLTLTRPDGTAADQVQTPVDIPPDISYGRGPDATGAWRFFVQPTPGQSNLTTAADEFLEAPRFSHEAGFYTNAFSLSLSTSNQAATIRYTLDGSEPTATSPAFTTSIGISNRTSLPNTLSLIPTTPGGISPPSRSVYKFMVVRAKAFRTNAVASPTVTRTFIVDPRGGERFRLPVVSLTSPRANFFDPNIGIYVPGNAPGGNYAQSGDAWERPGHIEFFDTNGVTGFSQGTGIRMHGNTSFQFPVKGLRLHALNPPGDGPFRYQIFPDWPVKTFNRLLLRPSGHDYNLTLFRDVFMQSLGRELGLDTQIHRPALLFLNGEYWGIHHCQEAFEPGYFSAHHPEVDPEAIDYLEGYASAVNGDTARWEEMIGYISTHDLRDPVHFAKVQSYMDTSNFIDFKISEIFYYRWDIGNHRPWRPRTPEGKFRWILFDCDVGWGGFWAVPPAWAFRMLDYDLEPNGPWTQYQSNPGGNDHNSPVVTFLLRSLMTNPTFKSDFINRFADVMNTTFQSNHVIQTIDGMATSLAPEIGAHIDRWHAPSSLNEWSNNVSYLRSYAVQRPIFMRQQLSSRFGLGGTRLIDIAVNDTNAGSVRIHSLTVSAPLTAPWRGIYFKNHLIEVEARPNLGYRFVGWTGLTNRALIALLPMGEDLTFSATFEADPDYSGPEPKPFALSRGDYSMSQWSSLEPPGTYPPHMLFTMAAVPDPLRSDAFEIPWQLPYDRTSRSRIVGLEEEGIGFLNTSDAQNAGSGFAGAVLLALDTRGLNQAEVSFRGRTLLVNSRSYALRLQYRLGGEGVFQDLTDAHGKSVDYLRSETANSSLAVGPIPLPPELLNRAYVQLRWIYHFVAGQAGTRAFLALDDVRVSGRSSVDPPQFDTARLISATTLRFEIRGHPGASYRLQTSRNLVEWTDGPLVTISADGTATKELEISTEPGNLFFRMIP